MTRIIKAKYAQHQLINQKKLLIFCKKCKQLTGFIRSGKIRGKHIFFKMVRESQGESGKVREFNEKVRIKLEKVREIFLESSYLL